MLLRKLNFDFLVYIYMIERFFLKLARKRKETKNFVKKNT